LHKNPPFRIAGNLYYVGTYDLACYLITTPEGNILINTGLDGSEQMIKKHIETLGFKFADIKILLTNHAHYDHVGALAAIKKMTHAMVEISANDAPVVADGGKSDYVVGYKGATFAAVKPDVLLHNHDTVKLGGMNIEVIATPGHTKGACSFLFDVKDNKRSYRVLIVNMPSIWPQTNLRGMPTYANVGSDYAATFRTLKGLHFDIWLAAHAGQFDLGKKHKPGDAYNPMAFVDGTGYDKVLAGLYADYKKRLKDKQQAKK
jgi:metallo-beta-lactamase class B